MAQAWLEANGAYWRVRWFDTTGRKRSRNLGPRASIGKREAKRQFRTIQAELVTNPSAQDASGSCTLGAWLSEHRTLRKGRVSSGTLTLDADTERHLLRLLSPSLQLRSLTRAHAEDWLELLAEHMQTATVAGHMRRARAMLGRAVDRGLLTRNPWADVRPRAPKPAKDWRELSHVDITRLLEAAPSAEWRSLLALCGWAGLRLGEALAIEWDGVRWDEGRLVVPQPKTAKATGRATRDTLMVPELERALAEGLDVAKGARVADVPANNLHRDVRVIQRRAGLEPWRDPFQTLRRWRASTWATEYPARVVDAWMGHSGKVAMDHYFRVPDELYGKGREKCPDSAAKFACVVSGHGYTLHGRQQRESLRKVQLKDGQLADTFFQHD